MMPGPGPNSRIPVSRTGTSSTPSTPRTVPSRPQSAIQRPQTALLRQKTYVKERPDVIGTGNGPLVPKVEAGSKPGPGMKSPNPTDSGNKAFGSYSRPQTVPATSYVAKAQAKAKLFYPNPPSEPKANTALIKAPPVRKALSTPRPTTIQPRSSPRPLTAIPKPSISVPPAKKVPLGSNIKAKTKPALKPSSKPVVRKLSSKTSLQESASKQSVQKSASKQSVQKSASTLSLKELDTNSTNSDKQTGVIEEFCSTIPGLSKDRYREQLYDVSNGSGICNVVSKNDYDTIVNEWDSKVLDELLGNGPQAEYDSSNRLDSFPSPLLLQESHENDNDNDEVYGEGLMAYPFLPPASQERLLLESQASRTSQTQAQTKSAITVNVSSNEDINGNSAFAPQSSITKKLSYTANDEFSLLADVSLSTINLHEDDQFPSETEQVDVMTLEETAPPIEIHNVVSDPDVPDILKQQFATTESLENIQQPELIMSTESLHAQVSARDFPQSFPATSSNEDIIDLQSLPKPVSPQIQFDHADDDYYETFGKETDKDLSDMVSIPKQITLKNDNAPYYSGLLLITNLSQDALIYKTKTRTESSHVYAINPIMGPLGALSTIEIHVRADFSLQDNFADHTKKGILVMLADAPESELSQKELESHWKLLQANKGTSKSSIFIHTIENIKLIDVPPPPSISSGSVLPQNESKELSSLSSEGQQGPKLNSVSSGKIGAARPGQSEKSANKCKFNFDEEYVNHITAKVNEDMRCMASGMTTALKWGSYTIYISSLGIICALIYQNVRDGLSGVPEESSDSSGGFFNWVPFMGKKSQ